MVERKYAGADWLLETLSHRKDAPKPSELGLKVADLLGDLFFGIYHLEIRSLLKVEWNCDYMIQINIRGGLSTFDFNNLTRFVIMCHDRCIRGEISGVGPNYLRLRFHQRTRDLKGISAYHPTIEEAVEQSRSVFPLEEKTT